MQLAPAGDREQAAAKAPPLKPGRMAFVSQPYEAIRHPPPGTLVKPSTLTIASMLSIILLPFHIAGDVALGFDKGGSGLVFVVVPALLIVACGTLLLSERRSGHVIMFLGGLAALGMPIIHRNNGFTAAVANAPGGLFFMWTLMALGVTGGLAIILSARGLWSLRSRKD